MNNPTDEGCIAQLLTRSAVGHVAACAACGNVHLTLEYVTVRLQPGAFRELATMVQEARRLLEGDPSLLPGASPEPLHTGRSDDSLH